MDRSILSDEAVIKASRDFVCIRLATYEDSKEAEFLKEIYRGRSGELENTVFALLAPDGKELLCKPGRAPNFTFRRATDLAKAMDVITLGFPGKEVESKVVRVPQMKNFRLSLNVASCDGLPLITAVSNDEKELERLKKSLEVLAFDDDLAGKFIFASCDDPKQMVSVKGFKSESGICVIRPGDYGLEGELVEQFEASVKDNQLKENLVAFAKTAKKVEKNHNSHVRAGNRAGTKWETEIEVTDPDSKRAMERGQRGGRGR